MLYQTCPIWHVKRFGKHRFFLYMTHLISRVIKSQQPYILFMSSSVCGKIFSPSLVWMSVLELCPPQLNLLNILKKYWARFNGTNNTAVEYIDIYALKKTICPSFHIKHYTTKYVTGWSWGINMNWQGEWCSPILYLYKSTLCGMQSY